MLGKIDAQARGLYRELSRQRIFDLLEEVFAGRKGIGAGSFVEPND